MHSSVFTAVIIATILALASSIQRLSCAPVTAATNPSLPRLRFLFPRRHQSIKTGTLSMMSSSMSSSSSSASTSVRVATYNILSSSLAAPDYFVKCNPDHLSPPKRIETIREKLQEEVNQESVICLQEVSQMWAGLLHTYFAERGYHFVTGMYGNKFNGYMGVGIAVPLKKFDLLDVDITRIADTKRLPKQAKPSFIVGLVQNIWNKLLAALKSVGLYKPPYDAWNEALWKNNQMVSVRLKPKSSLSGDKSKAFCVGTYHMPCAFRYPALMMIHCSLSAKHIAKYAKKDPYVYTGDFNIKPDSSMYRLLTEGEVEQNNPELPEGKKGDEGWSISVPPLRSAYQAALGKEPEFTNWAYSKDQPEDFVGTLDYIFLSDSWIVDKVSDLPQKSEICGPLPTESEPSDHLKIAAELSLK